MSQILPTGPLAPPVVGAAGGVPPAAGTGAAGGISPAGAPATPGRSSGSAAPATGPSFAEVLARSADGAQAPSFSRHALERASRRGIPLDGATVARLAGGISRAAAKGSRDAVVFVDRTAFVVSVPNNTVITAVGSEHMREHVFTNIDSAVIA
ncbi:MAG TPA: TIGR02530 family flagellar biosynthesis protein [Solirubrobacteraceae bacterium]|nr:TIGR02530 family flagellar biosynthesis protein [Solirubrobacteraceae bacterium]